MIILYDQGIGVRAWGKYSLFYGDGFKTHRYRL